MPRTLLIDGRGQLRDLSQLVDPAGLAAVAAAPRYRLYRLLHDIEVLGAWLGDETEELLALVPRVRRLLADNPWLADNYLDPDPELRSATLPLYDEPDFELELKTVAWEPGEQTEVHSHGGWAIVALFAGRERHRIFTRPGPGQAAVEVAQLELEPGDLVALTHDAIHQVETLGDATVVSLNLYAARTRPAYASAHAPLGPELAAVI